MKRKGAGQRGRMALLLVLLLCFHEVLGIATSSYERFAAVHSSRFNNAWPTIKHDPLARRAKSTKGSESNDNDPSSSTKNGPLTLAASGLQMTLSGLEPLDANSIQTWQDVTRDFVAADIWETQKKVKELDLSINFMNQDPPFESRRLRNLATTSVRRVLQESSELGITFNVDMVIESKEAASLNAFNLVESAFNVEQKRAMYMEKLRSTGDPAFASATLETSIVSSAAAPSKGRNIGIALAITIVLVIIIAVLIYILHGNRTNAGTTQVMPENETTKEEEESLPESPRVVSPRPTAPRSTATSPQESPQVPTRNGIPRTIFVDDGSQYFNGDVSVAWSMDTESQAQTQISNLT